jgi:hypothetical protein
MLFTGSRPSEFVVACDKREAFAQGSVSDEAIQSVASGLLRFVLAMTEKARVRSCPPINLSNSELNANQRSRDANRARAVGSVTSSKQEGAGNAGRGMRTRSLACEV